MKFGSLLRKKKAFLALLGCIFILGILTNTSSVAYAQSTAFNQKRATLAPTTIDDHMCLNSSVGNYDYYCFAPDYPTINSTCKGPQFFSQTDYLGNSIYYTYTNGSSWCVSVNYYPLNNGNYHYLYKVGKVCDFYFYVPDGWATATFKFGWWDKNNHEHFSNNLYENTTTGWQHIFTAQASDGQVQRINFGDNNGQAPGSRQIGWGRYQSLSLEADCH